MNNEYLSLLVTQLQAQGVVFAEGLGDDEVNNIEATYDFRFPPDLKTFLQFQLPISDVFVDWRNDSYDEIKRRLAWPIEGICLAVERKRFWLAEWGVKPTDMSQALEVARQATAQAPLLIPVFSHRFLPSEPCEAGNPIFSVYITDIIHYGNDLASYLGNEFGVDLPSWAAKEPRPIQFWDKFLDGWKSMATIAIADPREIPQPNPALSPQEVITYQLKALQQNDVPLPDSGITTTFVFASPANRAATGPLQRFIRMVKNPLYASLLNFASFELGPLTLNDERASQLVKLTGTNGKTVVYVFSLSKQHYNEYEGCWMTDGVVLVSD